MPTRVLLWPFFIVVLAGYAVAQSQGTFTPRKQPAGATTTAHREDYDPLLDLPPLPHNTVTLIGGTVTSLDEIMNRMVVTPFGSKRKMSVAFDTRTHFFRDGKPISYRDIRQGQRVYLDTMLNGSKVFAKQIWIQSSADSGIGRGQVLDYDADHRMLTVRDELSNQPVRLHLTKATVVRNHDQSGSSADLREGALVSLSFGPGRELREINVLATPGSTFTFAGQLTYLDLSRKLISVNNATDRNKYDISIEAIPLSIARQLHEGETVAVSAVFDGTGYAARSIQVSRAASTQAQ